MPKDQKIKLKDKKNFLKTVGSYGHLFILSFHVIQAPTGHLYGRHGAGHSGSGQEQHRSPVLEGPWGPQ